jgi:hypothetical protein
MKADLSGNIWLVAPESVTANRHAPDGGKIEDVDIRRMIDVRRLEIDTPQEEAEGAEDAGVVVVGATVRREGTTTTWLQEGT